MRTDNHGRIVNNLSSSGHSAMAEGQAVPRHWEGDLLCGSNNSQIVTLVEALTRYVMLARVGGKHTETEVNS
jgi:IS30 family transposase